MLTQTVTFRRRTRTVSSRFKKRRRAARCWTTARMRLWLQSCRTSASCRATGTRANRPSRSRSRTPSWTTSCCSSTTVWPKTRPWTRASSRRSYSSVRRWASSTTTCANWSARLTTWGRSLSTRSASTWSAWSKTTSCSVCSPNSSRTTALSSTYSSHASQPSTTRSRTTRTSTPSPKAFYRINLCPSSSKSFCQTRTSRAVSTCAKYSTKSWSLTTTTLNTLAK